jgi:hypothetical protein
MSYETGGDSFGIKSSPLAWMCNGMPCKDGYFRAMPGADHLSKQLNEAGKSWKVWFGAMPGDGTICPNSDNTAGYSADHNANLYFDDVTGNPLDPMNKYCIEHERPLKELMPDLKAGKEMNYNMIIPTDQAQGEKPDTNFVDPDTGMKPAKPDLIRQADVTAQTLVTGIMQNSAAWKKGTAIIFVVWDEPDFSNSTDTCGMIVVSPKSKKGYAGMVNYANGHASLVKTVEEVFGLKLLRVAAEAGTQDLADMIQGSVP